MGSSGSSANLSLEAPISADQTEQAPYSADMLAMSILIASATIMVFHNIMWILELCGRLIQQLRLRVRRDDVAQASILNWPQTLPNSRSPTPYCTNPTQASSYSFITLLLSFTTVPILARFTPTFTMSFLFGGQPKLSSEQKIAAAETEVEMVSDMFNRSVSY